MSPSFQPFPVPGGFGPPPGRATGSRFQTARPRSLITPPPLVASEPIRTGASGLRLQGGAPTHNRSDCNRSTRRRNIPCHGFHDSSRYTIRRLVRTTWHGTWINATQKVVNSIRSSDRFSARCLSAHRGCSGTSYADHAFSVHARLAITMYAQLLTRSSTGIASAFTPLLSWAIRFSWSQRSLARNTTSDAGVVRSLVM